jgi:hypothetical protein
MRIKKVTFSGLNMNDLEILTSNKEDKTVQMFIEIFGKDALNDALKLGMALKKEYVPHGINNVVEIK